MSGSSPGFVRLAVGLAAAAGLSVLVAIVVAVLDLERSKPSFTSELAFPQLADKTDAIAAFVIKTAEESATISLNAQTGWTLPERDGYAAKFTEVNRLFQTMAELRKAEPRSALVKWHERLGLVAPADGGAGRVFDIQDAEAKSLATVIAGTAAGLPGEGGASSLYIRFPGDDQAWLATAPKDLSTFSADPSDWLETEILDLPKDKIASVRLEPAGGAPYTVTRSTPEQANFEIADLPGELKLKSEASANAPVNALADLTLRDVSRADRIDFAEGLSKAEYRTFDGLVVSVDHIKLGEDHWIRLSPSAAGDAEEAAVALADALKAKLDPWVFQIDSWHGGQLTTALDNLVEPATNDAGDPDPSTEQATPDAPEPTPAP